MPNTLLPNRFKVFSGSMLKLIAVIAMLIDHSAYILAAEIPFLSMPLFMVDSEPITLYYMMRLIGRLAFPIFCFLISGASISDFL